MTENDNTTNDTTDETGGNAVEPAAAAVAAPEPAAAAVAAPEPAAAAVAAPEPEGDEKEKEFVFVEEPAFDVESKGDCLYEVKVTIPVANEKKLSDEAFEELRHEAEVPGFRRGRAPRKLLERKFSKAVRSDVELKLVNAAFKKLIKDKGLHPISTPDVDGLEKPQERKTDEPLFFTFKFEVRPRVELGKYRGVEVERPVFKVEDQDVDAAIADIRSRFGVFENVEGGTAQTNDQILINFKGTVDGEEFPGGSAENYPYILGTKRFFPEFEEVLLGSSPGAQLTCNVSFGDNYSAQHLRGKTAAFAITVNGIKRRNVPELTDEFAQQLGYENVQDMRARVALRMRATTENQSNRIAGARAVAAIINSSAFELPKSLLDSIAEDYYEERIEELKKAHVTPSQVKERDAEILAAARELATKEIKEWTVLSEIADAEGIEVTDEDFEKEAALIRARTGASAEEITKHMGEDEQRNRYVVRILNAKALEAVMSHAVITDKEVSRKELEATDTGESKENEEDD